MLGDSQRVLGPTHFLSVFIFGEQGCVMPQQAMHGNWMTGVPRPGNG